MLVSSKSTSLDSYTELKSVTLRVAIAQINPKLGDLAANLALYEEKIRQGIKERAEFLLFPELSLTGYFLRDTVPSVACFKRSRKVK